MDSKPDRKTEVVISLRIPSAMNDKAKRVARKCHLKNRAEVLRLAVDRGLDRLLEQLTADKVA